MNIALIGYGKMGKIIERLAKERGHVISLIVDENNQSQLLNTSIPLDVAIEFTAPSAAVDNIKVCLERNLPVVVGTTGWQDRLADVRDLVNNEKGTVFYASNFSLGVNIFFKLNNWLSKVMNQHRGYQVKVDEVHHVHKLDKPSGTAITIAEEIISQHEGYATWSLDTADKKGSLPIYSHRTDEVPGTHQVTYSGPIDEIELKHTAKSREGFALGAIMVSEWLPGKKGLLTMDDYLKF